MQELELEISFNTPAFLGNANQTAQWRTPPFKTLIRQWWRIVKAKSVNYNIQRLLRLENELFGSAAEDNPKRSALRLRLDPHWQMGSLSEWKPLPANLAHSEVGRSISPDLYLGYGPLEYGRQAGTVFSTRDGTKRTAIKVEEQTARLWLAFPDEYAQDLKAAVTLIAWFGTIGSRSRNGWGSLHISSSKNFEIAKLEKNSLNPYLCDISNCLTRDWPSAIGQDEKGPLVWRTPTYDTWQEVIQKLAEIKIAFRTALKFSGGGPHTSIERRHLLAYPVTNHTCTAFKRDARIANQIRFKVSKSDGKFLGIICHLPCKIPTEILEPRTINQTVQQVNNIMLTTWQDVAKKIDELLPKGRIKE